MDPFAEKNWRKFLAGIYGGNGRVCVAVVKHIRSRRRDPLFGHPHAPVRLGPFGFFAGRLAWLSPPTNRSGRARTYCHAARLATSALASHDRLDGGAARAQGGGWRTTPQPLTPSLPHDPASHGTQARPPCRLMGYRPGRRPIYNFTAWLRPFGCVNAPIPLETNIDGKHRNVGFLALSGRCTVTPLISAHSQERTCRHLQRPSTHGRF